MFLLNGFRRWMIFFNKEYILWPNLLDLLHAYGRNVLRLMSWSGYLSPYFPDLFELGSFSLAYSLFTFDPISMFTPVRMSAFKLAQTILFLLNLQNNIELESCALCLLSLMLGLLDLFWLGFFWRDFVITTKWSHNFAKKNDEFEENGDHVVNQTDQKWCKAYDFSQCDDFDRSRPIEDSKAYVKDDGIQWQQYVVGSFYLGSTRNPKSQDVVAHNYH